MESRLCRMEQSYGDVLALWQHDLAFRTHFLTLLAEQPYSAFRWEMPPLTRETLDQPFEFVTLDSPWLERDADPLAFAEHFSPTEQVVAFPNLSGDCTLVVPCPTSHPAAYPHLAAFVRYAPEEQQHTLLALVGKTVEAQLSDQPLWLSTAGAGVAWLHVRLDKRPKYYGYAPYTSPHPT